MTRWIFGIAGILALGWISLWAFAAWSARQSIEDWFAARATEGWQAEYATLEIRGFPSRVDATLTDVQLYDPEARVGWEGAVFQILALSYKPGHEILVWPAIQTLRLPEGDLRIESTGLRASLIHTADGEILRANVEAEVLNLNGRSGTLAMAAPRLNLHQKPGEPGLYRLALGAEALAGPQGPLSSGAATDGLRVQSDVAFDAPFTTRFLEDPRPQPTRIDLRLAEYRWEGLEINLAGTVEMDRQGRPDGEMTLRAVNWRALLRQARDAGHLPEGLADTLEAGLGLAAQLRGGPDTIDLPLRFDEGRASLGVIPLGKAPSLSLP